MRTSAASSRASAWPSPPASPSTAASGPGPNDRMRRRVRWAMRAGLLALLVLAIIDPPFPASGPRTRVYVLDLSGSARKTTGTESFTPEDALRLASHDLGSLRSGDRVALVVFGAKPSILVPLTEVSK